MRIRDLRNRNQEDHPPSIGTRPGPGLASPAERESLAPMRMLWPIGAPVATFATTADIGAAHHRIRRERGS